MQTDFSFGGQIQTLRGKADECELEVFYQGKLLKKCVFSLDEKYTRFQVRLMENDFVYESLYWTLEHPRLLDVVIRLYSSGVQCDEAETRFGMRKISVNESGVICLNNRPLYQKLIWNSGGKAWKYEYKYRRGGKTLCSLYARENCIGFMVIFGKDERANFEAERDSYTKATQAVYDKAQTYYDGKWLMFEPKDSALFSDFMRLLRIKRRPNRRNNARHTEQNF